MILGIVIMIHFRKKYYKTHEGKSKVANCTGPFTVTIISEQGTRLESSRFSIDLVWLLVLVYL